MDCRSESTSVQHKFKSMLMDSQWINRLVDGLNNQRNNGNDSLDLTLKLGVPNGCSNQNRDQLFHFVPNMAPHGQANFNRYDQNYTQNVDVPQENTHAQVYGFVPIMTSHGRINLNNIDTPNNTQVRNNHYDMRNNVQSNAYRFGGQRFTGFSSAAAAPFYSYRPQPQTNTNLNMNPNVRPLHAMNNYTVLNHFPRRRVNRSGSSSSIVGGSRSQSVYSTPQLECSNYNCKTTSTPMWRKGPLGHKSLCNACGLKYARMEYKRRANEAADNDRAG